MTDVVGNPEEERRAEFYYQPWAQEAVCRYFYSKVMRRVGFPGSERMKNNDFVISVCTEKHHFSIFDLWCNVFFPPGPAEATGAGAGTRH